MLPRPSVGEVESLSVEEALREVTETIRVSRTGGGFPGRPIAIAIGSL